MKVLYVEDEPSLREEVALILEMEDYEVKTAENGVQGLEMIKSFLPDVIISDIRMPEMTGEEMLVEIRLSDFRHIPVILVTAFATPDWSERLLEKGASAFITKPFSIDDLLGTIQKFG